MNKARQLALLRDQWAACTRCGLCQTRSNVVFGAGSPEAQILILGEAPGPEEDKEGEPFVGEAGKILEVFLSETNIDKENVFVTNALGCRPTMENIDDRTGKSVVTNRAPSKEEKLACKERVLQTIYIIDPFLIIALGQTALSMLLGRTNQLSKMRGHVYTMHTPGKQVDDIRYPVIAMYHPSFLARNLDYSNPEGVWYQTGRDFKTVQKAISYIDMKYYEKKKEPNGEGKKRRRKEDAGSDE